MSGVDRVPSGVNRRLWSEALEMADGDRARIEIRSATSVIVHNTADWTPAAPAKAPKDAAETDDTAGSEDPRPTATVTAIPPTPEWKSAAPARGRQHARGGPKSDVPSFLAPVPGGLR